jgi:hypothetical protein
MNHESDFWLLVIRETEKIGSMTVMVPSPHLIGGGGALRIIYYVCVLLKCKNYWVITYFYFVQFALWSSLELFKKKSRPTFTYVQQKSTCRIFFFFFFGSCSFSELLNEKCAGTTLGSTVTKQDRPTPNVVAAVTDSLITLRNVFFDPLSRSQSQSRKVFLNSDDFLWLNNKFHDFSVLENHFRNSMTFHYCAYLI